MDAETLRAAREQIRINRAERAGNPLEVLADRRFQQRIEKWQEQGLTERQIAHKIAESIKR